MRACIATMQQIQCASFTLVFSFTVLLELILEIKKYGH